MSTDDNYPIIEQRKLNPVPRRLRGRSRSPEEIPVAAAHQRLVYRINGDLEEDCTSLSLKSDKVLAADFVTLVDMRAHVKVPIRLTIRSSEESKLTVEVVFTCTVTGAREVAATGVNAAASLTQYLEGHHTFYELALGYTVAEINEIRRLVNARVTSFTTVQPPNLPGMFVAMASVQVHTPEEWENFSAEREKASIKEQWLRLEHDTRVRSAELLFEEKSRTDELSHSSEVRETERAWVRENEERQRQEFREVDDQRRKHGLEYEDQRQRELLEVKRLDGEIRRRRAEQAAQREEVRLDAAAIGDDPVLALYRAYQAGKLDERELTERITEQRREAAAWRDRQLELERGDRLREREWAREDELRVGEWAREDRNRALEQAERLDRDRTEWDHEQYRLDRADRVGVTEFNRELLRLDRAEMRTERERDREDRNRDSGYDHERRMRELEYERERLDREIERERERERLAHELKMEQLKAESRRLEIETEGSRLGLQDRYSVEREDKVRAHELRLEEIRSERSRLELETGHEREDKVREHDLALERLRREEARAEVEAERLRDEQRREREAERWEVEQLTRQEAYTREDEVRRAGLEGKILLALLESGHANAMPLDVQQLINDAVRRPQRPAVTAKQETEAVEALHGDAVAEQQPAVTAKQETKELTGGQADKHKEEHEDGQDDGDY
ncbi:hypothetical protein GCM10017673_48490 [Streptosporangium violaceochromogenes]|nr:hypothetical protein GCM10017673_48490 [Streptosporangium violaceochromogenes]